MLNFDSRWFFKRRSTSNSIVLFDGVCGLCNGFINFLIKRDRNLNLRFAPLQGETAKQYVDAEFISTPGTVVLVEDGQIYTKSEAILRILLRVGGVWKFAFFLFIIPSFLRNIVYDFIAKHRYKWFGKYETCRLPTAEERKHFLP